MPGAAGELLFCRDDKPRPAALPEAKRLPDGCITWRLRRGRDSTLEYFRRREYDVLEAAR